MLCNTLPVIHFYQPFLLLSILNQLFGLNVDYLMKRKFLLIFLCNVKQCNNEKVLTVTFDQFNAPWWNKTVDLF